MEEITAILETWTEWQSSPGADVESYLNALRSQPNLLEPYILVFYRDELPEAMLIGTRHRTRFPYRLGYWTVKAPSARVLSFAYGGLLGNQSPENGELAVNELINCLSENEADVVVLHNVKTDCSLYHAAIQVNFVNRDHAPQIDMHCSMDLPNSYEEIDHRLSGEHRWDLRRKARKLMDAFGGEVEMRRFCTPPELKDAIPYVEEIAKTTYQRALGVGFNNSPEMIERLTLCAERGWLRSYVLFTRGCPCAFVIGTLFRGTFHLDYLGYDPSCGKQSPGTFLFMKILQSLCAEGVKGIDFGNGDEMYKRRFGNRLWKEARVHLFNTSPRGVLLNLIRMLTVLIDRTARSLLKRVTLFGTLKARWRKALKERQAAKVNKTQDVVGIVPVKKSTQS